MIVAVIVFTLIRLVPGDPAAVIAGNMATNETSPASAPSSAGSRLLHLVGIWAKGMASGDLGSVIFLQEEVTALIGEQLEPTSLSLAFLTIMLTVLVAVPLGTLATWRHGGWLNRALMGSRCSDSRFRYSCSGYLLVYFFALKLDWFPGAGLPAAVARASGRGCISCCCPPSHYRLCMSLIARVTCASVASADRGPCARLAPRAARGAGADAPCAGQRCSAHCHGHRIGIAL